MVSKEVILRMVAETKEEVLKGEERLRLVLRAAQMGVWDWDFTKNSGWESQEVGLIYGREEGYQHASLEDWASDIHPEDRQRAWKDLQDAIAGDRPYDSTYRVLWPDGKTIHWVQGQAKFLRDEQNRAQQMFGWVLDVTYRKEAERLRLLLALIVQSTNDAIISKDLGGIITTWNPAAERMFGHAAEEAIGQPMTMLIPPERAEEEPRILEQIRRGERVLPFETKRLRKDGTRIDVSVSISPVRDGKGNVIGASKVARDITERKKAEAALRRSEESLRAVIQTAVEGIITIDERGTMLSANPAAEKIFGYTAEEMLGRNVSMLIPEPNKHQHDQYLANYHRTGQAKIIGIGREVEGQRKDGTVFPMELAVGESRIGNEHFYTGLLKDISQRKAAERALRENEERFRAELEKQVQERTARLQEAFADLEHFSYSITHDMRAPLRAMQGFAELLANEHREGLPPEHRDYLDRIITASQRLDNLITDALSFGQATRYEPELKPVDATALLRGIIDSYPAFQPPRANVEIEGDIPLILGNEAGLTQCFSNLLSNAVKFVEPGKAPKVRVWAETRENFVRLWFADNGVGIPKEQQGRIFEMFQRVSNRYEGTGIGLALVRKVVARMGGRVGVESAVGEGSRFWIELKAGPDVPRAG